ncbi:MAG: hypothetical protein OEZ35_01125 [Candidatus Bathyarchaeota archaeon]|nr:hypothetical protein [Candidatus Bathyarchaeota archaeon]
MNRDGKLRRLRVVVVPTLADDDNCAFAGSNLAVPCMLKDAIEQFRE